MRNIFDQYSQPENRLSHALAVTLDEDRWLLRRFLQFVDAALPPSLKRIAVVEQRLPGDPPDRDAILSERSPELRGLPDIVIHDDDQWCVVIESKVMAPLTDAQVDRHERTLRRRGFSSITRVALTTADSRMRRTCCRSWPDLYRWLNANRERSAWASRLHAYFRALETRLVDEGYLTEGTLTMFDGFPFSAAHPYNYGEAKRVLGLAMQELRKSKVLLRMGMDPEAPGRAAITGRLATHVWDYLAFKSRPRQQDFTKHPHFTLALHHDHLEVAITIPNNVDRRIRRRLTELGASGLSELHALMLRRGSRLIGLGAKLQAYALQRHYLSQRSHGIEDARLVFRLETSLPQGRGRVRPQLEWTSAFAEIVRRKASNIQLGYLVAFPWGTGGLNGRESLSLMEQAWQAIEPVLDAVME